MTEAKPGQTSPGAAGSTLGGAGSPLTSETLAPLTSPQVEELVPSEAVRRRPRHERGAEPLLKVSGLQTSFHTRDGVVRAVTGVDFEVDRGEILGLVGESGCGKSVTSMSIMGLIARPGVIEGGSVVFDGRDLLKLSGEEMRHLRGDRISMIFQQPQSSLNPVWDVGRQIGEVLEIHRNMQRKAARARALDLLKMVGIPDPERRLKAFPHEMSGGMAQRVMIAMALACEPELLIADEPTTALDVTIQAQVLDLLRELRERRRTTIVLITHDLGVIAQICDRVGVMYAGQLFEVAGVEDIFHAPRHPYTQALLQALPSAEHARGELRVIGGRVPDLTDPPPGCRFAPRCPHRMDECDLVPPLAHETQVHAVACWLSEATRRAAGLAPLEIAASTDPMSAGAGR
jgi:peptide/nickel transport system ATP-binding protein